MDLVCYQHSANSCQRQIPSWVFYLQTILLQQELTNYGPWVKPSPPPAFISLFQIYVPLMLVNAADDPLVHESLLAIPKSLSGKCFFPPLSQPLSKLPQYIAFTTLTSPGHQSVLWQYSYLVQSDRPGAVVEPVLSLSCSVLVQETGSSFITTTQSLGESPGIL